MPELTPPSRTQPMPSVHAEMAARLESSVPERIYTTLGFPSKLAFGIWGFLFFTLVPWSTYLRFHFLSNAILEPHGWRESQTALTIFQFFKLGPNLLDYSSPFKLWSWVLEFPLYQWLAYLLMRTGLPLEVSARLVTLCFFCGGTVVFTAIVLRLFGKQCACWAALFYWITPFNVILSRTCLIDFTSLFFVLCSIWLFLKAIETTSIALWWLAAATVFGSIGSLVKVTTWIAPMSLQGLVLLYIWNRNSLPWRRAFSVFMIFLPQIAVAFAWMEWTNHVRSLSWGGSWSGSWGWYMGSWLSQAQWLRIFYYIGTYLLNYWLFIPFAMGIFFLKKQLHYVAFCSFLILCPILLFFNVHEKHDYYLIAEVPYFIALAGLGMARILFLPRRAQYVVLGLILPIFAYAMKGLPPRYELITANFHRTQAMEMPKKIRLLSSEKDIIWMDLPSGGLYIPLYAQRWIAMDPLVKLSDLNPTLLRLKKDWRPMSYLRSLPRVWIDGSKTNFYFYRVREVDGFPYDPHRHLAVSDEDSGPGVKWGGRGVLKIDSCRRGGNKPVGVAIRNPSGYLSIYAERVNHSFFLPAKKYVNLPPESPWGCRFEIRRKAEF